VLGTTLTHYRIGAKLGVGGLGGSVSGHEVLPAREAFPIAKEIKFNLKFIP